VKPIPILNEIEWREPGLGPTSEGHWPRNEFLPNVYEVRWTISIFPVALQVRNRVWFLFEPGAAVFNGLSDDPIHMNQAAVIEVEILQRQIVGPVIYTHGPSPTDRDFSWLQVRCLQVIPLWDIPNHFGETSPLKDFYRSSKKGAESDKMVEFWIEPGEGNSDACYLTKTTPPRAVLRISDWAGQSERVILNSALD
jgi:hypothetical protein